MMIDDQKWAAIIEETKGGIDRWNAKAAERGLEDRFFVHVFDLCPHIALVTEHREHFGREARAVVREASGHIRKAKMTVKKGIARIKHWNRQDPKAWDSLAEKAAADIVRKLGLLNYVMIVGASFGGGGDVRGAPRS